jgi:hypothetical protein
MVDSISDLRKFIEDWPSRRMTRIEPIEWHCVFKLPFEIEHLRESLIYRLFELVDAGVALLDTENFLGSVICSRSAQETISALSYIDELIDYSLKNGEVSHLREMSRRLMFGRHNSDLGIDKINILTLISKVDRRLPGFEKQYFALSEYAHPNWSGAMGLFAQTGGKEIRVDFARYIRGSSAINTHIQVALINSVAMFQLIEEEYAPLARALIELCDHLHDNSELLPQVTHPPISQNPPLPDMA